MLSDRGIFCVIVVLGMTWGILQAIEMMTYRVRPTIGNRVVERLTGTPMGWSPKFVDNYTEVWKQVNAKTELEKLGIRPNPEFANTSIFHLRCSDIGEYNLTDLVRYAKAVKKHGPFVISWCGGHTGGGSEYTRPEHCPEAALEVARVLHAPVMCWSIKQTLDNFAGAKTLVGTTGSFAFIVGITRPQTFVFPVFEDASVSVPWHVVNISGINRG